MLALVQIIAWCQTGKKPLSVRMMAYFTDAYSASMSYTNLYWQQAIIWTNIDEDILGHMPPLCHNELILFWLSRAVVCFFQVITSHVYSLLESQAHLKKMPVPVSIIHVYRADSRFAPSQWETSLLCNDVSHWLSASLESALIYLSRLTHWTLINVLSILKVISKHMLSINFMSTCEIALTWRAKNTCDDKSPLVQPIAWCHRAASHTWANVDLYLCFQMVPQVHNESISLKKKDDLVV